MAKVMFEFKDGGSPEQLAQDLGLMIRDGVLYQSVKDEREKDQQVNVGYIVAPKSMPGTRVIELRGNYSDLVQKARKLPYMTEFSFTVPIGGG